MTLQVFNLRIGPKIDSDFGPMRSGVLPRGSPRRLAHRTVIGL
jgi:hypothetical protein